MFSFMSREKPKPKEENVYDALEIVLSEDQDSPKQQSSLGYNPMNSSVNRRRSEFRDDWNEVSDLLNGLMIEEGNEEDEDCEEPDDAPNFPGTKEGEPLWHGYEKNKENVTDFISPLSVESMNVITPKIDNEGTANGKSVNMVLSPLDGNSKAQRKSQEATLVYDPIKPQVVVRKTSEEVLKMRMHSKFAFEGSPSPKQTSRHSRSNCLKVDCQTEEKVCKECLQHADLFPQLDKENGPSKVKCQLSGPKEQLDPLISTVEQRRDSPSEEDPMAWAYDVWRRVGIMPGAVKGYKRPVSMEHESTTGSQESDSNSQEMSSITRRIRHPKDRLSLPAKLPIDGHDIRASAKTGNFSGLLNKWREKSHDKPLLHIHMQNNTSPLASTKSVISAISGISADTEATTPQTKLENSAASKPVKEKISESRTAKAEEAEKIASEAKDCVEDENSSGLSADKLPEEKETVSSSVLQENGEAKATQKEGVNDAKSSSQPMTSSPSKIQQSMAAKLMSSPPPRRPGRAKKGIRSRRSLSPSNLTLRSNASVRSGASSKRYTTPGYDTCVEPRAVSSRSRSGASVTSKASQPSLASKGYDVPYAAQMKRSHQQLSISQSIPCQEITIPAEKRDLLSIRTDSMSFDTASDIQSSVTSYDWEDPLSLGGKNIKSLSVNVQSPGKADMIRPSNTKATPEYSERPWRKDLLVRNVASAIQRANESDQCDCTNGAIFKDDHLVEFFLPLMGMACTCQKSRNLLNPMEPMSLNNILRHWQVEFLTSFGIQTGDQFVKAHHRSGRSLAVSLRTWRQEHGMKDYPKNSCAVALLIWSRTCKAYVRSIRRQLEHEVGLSALERPNTLGVLSSFLERMPEELSKGGSENAVDMHGVQRPTPRAVHDTPMKR